MAQDQIAGIQFERVTNLPQLRHVQSALAAHDWGGPVDAFLMLNRDAWVVEYAWRIEGGRRGADLAAEVRRVIRAAGIAVKD